MLCIMILEKKSLKDTTEARTKRKSFMANEFFYELNIFLCLTMMIREKAEVVSVFWLEVLSIENEGKENLE